MRRFALSYTNKGDSPDNGTGCMDRTFDSKKELSDWMANNHYSNSYDYHIWELVGGVTLRTTVDVIETPPNLT